MDRRAFLHDLTRYAVLFAGVPNEWRVTRRTVWQENPFSLGVGSGDPLPDRCMIWTRLAPDPFGALWGMGGHRVVVDWEVAADEGFRRVVRQGAYTAAPELGYSVHVDVPGLEAGRPYFYRFHLRDGTSPVGRLFTAPAPGSTEALDFAFASCQNWEQGLFTAWEHLAREDLRLVAHLGDYIYEYAGRDDRVRRHHGYEILALDDYRARYAQYRSDPALQAAHALCPWIVTWDDHEVDNNYAASVGENQGESVEQMELRRAMGYQAWWENQPVRVPRPDRWADLTIRRSTAWGSLARLWVLDTRQYRSDQPCDDGNRTVPCGGWGDPSHTLLGDAQERWLVDGLAASSTRWQVLAQQIMMAPFDRDPGDETVLPMDMWSGYPVARDRLLGEIARRAPNRTVVLTGDIHSSWVNELPARFTPGPGSPSTGGRGGDGLGAPVAAEFVGTSISSGGDGSEGSARVDAAMEENPHLRWFNNRRGYVRCRVTPDAWETTYRTVDWVERPGAPVRDASRWRVEHGRPGIHRLD